MKIESVFSQYVFLPGLCLLGALYLFLLASLLAVNLWETNITALLDLTKDQALRSSLELSLLSSTLSAIMAVWAAIPIAYVLNRFSFPGKVILEWLAEMPIVLPPLVLGLSLLLLVQTTWGIWLQSQIRISYALPGVIVAQWVVATAFATRILRVAFSSHRTEEIAWTFGMSRREAFWRVVLPETRLGLLSAFTLAWARSLGEFGPILIFAGTTRMKTEVLPTSIYLELSVGNVQSAIAISVLMIAISLAVIIITRNLMNRTPA